MKKNKILKLLCCFVLAVMTLSSCKPDVQLASDYKDVTVVYGLLNPKDHYQYIKIYKGYLTQDNALVWAKNLDNISYYNDITVTIDEFYPNGNFRRTYNLDTVMSIAKNYGTFPSPTQVLYRLNPKSDHLREGYLYKLKIVDHKTGRVVTSETNTIDNMVFNIPLGTSQTISNININKDEPWAVGFKTSNWPENAYAVDAYLTFRYIEQNKVTGDTVHKSINDVCVTTGFTLGNEASFKPTVIFRI